MLRIMSAMVTCLALGNLGGPARGDYVRVVTERMDFSDGYVMADGSIYDGTSADLINGLVSDAWATFSQDYAVVRFYALFNDPLDQMVFFGAMSDPLSLNILGPSNNQFFDPRTDHVTPDSLLVTAFDPNNAFDSWLTIGAADSDTLNNQGSVVVTPGMPTSLVDGLDLTGDREGLGALWEVGAPPGPNPLTVPDALGRVLFAQITIERGTRYSFIGNIGFLNAGGDIEFERTFSLAAVPAPGALSLLAIAGLTAQRRRR